MNKKDFEHLNFSVTIPKVLSDRVDEINKDAEYSSTLFIGRSFTIRVALELLLKQKSPSRILVDRKLDTLRAKVMA